jgi:hypothetical protein
MTISLVQLYQKSEYEKELESSIDTNLSSISSNLTTINTAVSTFSANITTLSGNVTSLNDFVDVITATGTAVYTLSLATYRNFTITNINTADKTLKISNASTADDTMLNLNIKLTFTTTAAITYTSNITWSFGTAGATAAPNPSAAGTFLLNLKSFDAGVTWLGTYQGLY